MIPWLLRVLGYREYEAYELYDLVQTLDEDDLINVRFILVRVDTGPEETE